MNNLVQDEMSLILFSVVVFLAIGACLVAWAVIFEKWLSGKPLVEYQPRRRVPWRVWDILAIVGFYFVGLFVVVHLADYCLPELSLSSAYRFGAGRSTTAHAIVQLMAVRHGNIILMCFIAGVAVSPIAEEMFFRVLLQGWLENIDRRGRRRLPMWRRLMPLGAMPIVVSSLVFASQHFRKAAPPLDVELLVFLFAGNSAMQLLTLIFGIVLVRWRAGARAADLGWSPEKFFADLRMGIITFVAIVVPIYGGQIGLAQLLPKQYAPDPITIFFFAVALGFLYFRTHRAAPPIALHMALNASSLLMALFSAQ
jgi:membrane protease YdiL (CAAX protease family)